MRVDRLILIVLMKNMHTSEEQSFLSVSCLNAIVDYGDYCILTIAWPSLPERPGPSYIVLTDYIAVIARMRFRRR